MDDLMGRIQEMLSDEESMNQIKELADMLSLPAPQQNNSTEQANNNNNNNNNNNTTQKQQNNNNLMGDFDIGTIFKIQELMSSAKSDKNSELIMALKPHLNAERQEKADKAIKILKIISLWETLKSSGMLKNLDKLL